jgi:hypothetical protein
VWTRFPDDPSAAFDIGLDDKSFVAASFARDDDDVVGQGLNKGKVICIVSADVFIRYRHQMQVTEDLHSKF